MFAAPATGSARQYVLQMSRSSFCQPPTIGRYASAPFRRVSVVPKMSILALLDTRTMLSESGALRFIPIFPSSSWCFRLASTIASADPLTYTRLSEYASRIIVPSAESGGPQVSRCDNVSINSVVEVASPCGKPFSDEPGKDSRSSRSCKAASGTNFFKAAVTASLLELRLRLLAGQSESLIGEAMGIDHQIVFSYCIYYFDVRDSIHQQRFIHQSQGRIHGFNQNSDDLVYDGIENYCYLAANSFGPTEIPSLVDAYRH